MSVNARNPAAALNSIPVNQRVGQYQTYGLNLSQLLGAPVTYNNTAVLTNLMGLTLFTGTYYVKAVLNLNAAAAANNFRFTFAGAGANSVDGLVLDLNASYLQATWNLTGVAAQVDQMANFSIVVNGGVTNAWTQLVIEGGIRVVNAGTLQLQGAQNVAGATNSVVRGGSIMEAFYISP